MASGGTAAKVLAADDDVAGLGGSGVLRFDFAKDILGKFQRVNGDVVPAGDDLVGVHVLSERPGF
jgi:hypothetical protein